MTTSDDRAARLPKPPALLASLPRPFALGLHSNGGPPVLAAAGELDIAGEQFLRDTIAALLDGGADVLALDLSEVEFVDCAGLRAILAARKAAEARGGRLVLRSPSRAMRRIVELTGVELAFDPGR